MNTGGPQGHIPDLQLSSLKVRFGAGVPGTVYRISCWLSALGFCSQLRERYSDLKAGQIFTRNQIGILSPDLPPFITRVLNAEFPRVF